MKRSSMLIFFLVVFTIYFIANLYLFLKGYKVIPAGNYNRLIYTAVFILLASAFIAGKILERTNSTVFSDILNIIGGFWMAFMLYGFLILLLSDLIYPVLKATGAINQGNALTYRKWAYILTLSVTLVLITAGFINAVIPVARHYSIPINKPAGEIKKFRIAAVSDIHLGSIIRKRSIKHLSEMLREADPDVIFLLGDIVDGEIGPVLRDDLLSYFTCPKCRDGLYAITGNHEFIGGADVTIPYIESKGIRILKDEVVILENQIQVIGRLDRDGARFSNTRRSPLDTLVKKTDPSKPLIVLDHQPLNLEEAVKNGIDLQLSGHTHNGQMWPLNYVTKGIYEVSYGHKKLGETHIIVSSGFGIWGPRIRLGSRSEILIVDLAFEGKVKSE